MPLKGVPAVTTSNTMKLISKLKKPPYRTLVGCFLLAGLILIGYQIWSPGKVVVDGSHDLKRNGIWIQHGWLGDDQWFQQHKKKANRFRNAQNIMKLKTLLLDHNITDVYPHLCLCRNTGEIPAVNARQTRQFLQMMDEFRVIPWVGGVINAQAFPKSPQWQCHFIESIIRKCHEDKKTNRVFRYWRYFNFVFAGFVLLLTVCFTYGIL